MKFRSLSFFIYWIVRLLLKTVRLKVVGEEPVSDLQHQGSGIIFATWHGRTLTPMRRFRNRGYWAIISTSRDGEYQNHVFRRFGWNTVRGSTSARGAVKAALTMVRHLNKGATLAITPDGPRGPIHRFQLGAIFLAQKSGCPIVPAGISAAPRRLMRTWDRFLVPLPFSRAALVYGDPIYIPADAKSEDVQRQWADRVAAAINALESEADRMVGIKKCGEPVRRDANQWHRV